MVNLEYIFLIVLNGVLTGISVTIGSWLSKNHILKKRKKKPVIVVTDEKKEGVV